MPGFQGNGFGDAEAGAITQHQHCAVFEYPDVLKQVGYFSLAQYYGQFLLDAA
jgi:hypothetical protein